MTTPKRHMLRLAEVAARGVVPGIPLLMLIGLVGLGAWVVTSKIQGSRADWSVVGTLWCVLLFVFAIIGVLAGYWLPRVVFARRGWVRYVPDIDDWTVAIASTVPLGVLLTLIFQVEGVPVWLYVLGVGSVVLGWAAFVDTLQLGRGSKKQQGRPPWLR
jgi:hypothetical protein